MREYILFIDTEASGLPLDWNAPYGEAGNWPYAVQIAWVIYTRHGQPVKQENHYINNNDFEITPAAQAIHNLTQEFLLRQGESRQQVLELLTADLLYYQPLVVGHFMKFDARVLGAEYFRVGQENPLETLPAFCTLLASAQYVRNPRPKYLRLDELYHRLFNLTLDHQHHALVDATATADCFFEMFKKGEINEGTIAEQQLKAQKTNQPNKRVGCAFTAFAIFVITLLLSLWI